MSALFLTPDGRPALAWRIFLSLLALVLILVMCFSVPFLLLRDLLHLSGGNDLYQIAANGDSAGLLLPAYILGGLLAVGCAHWLRRNVDHRSSAGIAFTTLTGHRHELVLGWFLGCFIPLSAAGVALCSGLFSFGLVPLQWSQILVALLFWFTSGLSCAIRDEVLLRGYILQNLGERLPLWGATLLLAILSSLLCFPDNGLIWCINLLLLSIIWTCTRLLTRSLWLGIGIHAGFNTCTALLLALIGRSSSFLPLPGLLAGLELPFSAMLLAAVACWLLTRRLRINWRQRLHDEGQPDLRAVSPQGRVA